MFGSLFLFNLLVFANSETEKVFSTKDEQIIRKSQMVLDERNFDKITSKGNVFVKFYAPWCGHCQMMEDDWKDVGKFVQDNQELFKGKDLVIGEIDCVANAMTCLKQGVDGYPSIKLFKPKQGKVDEYFFARSAERMKRYLVDTFTDIDNMPEDSIGIVTLNDYTFEKFKDKTKYLVVKFHIPGCHHCQTFKETYDDLVLSMSFDPDAENIKFAQVNCMDMDSLEACSDEGVAGFPALHIYKDGDIEDIFSGERTEESLEKFIWDVVDPSRSEDDFNPFEMFAKMEGAHGDFTDGNDNDEEEEEFEECDCSDPECDCSEDYEDDGEDEDEEEDADYEDEDEETEDEFVVVNDPEKLKELLNEASNTEPEEVSKEEPTTKEENSQEEKSEEDTLEIKETNSKDEL